jgi:hypothetical protein
MKPRRASVSWLFAVLPASVGIFFLVLAMLPYPNLKTFSGSLLADGNFNSLKPWNVGVFKILFASAGSVFLGLALVTGLRYWNTFRTFIRKVWEDTVLYINNLRPNKKEGRFLIAVVAIMVLATIYRLEDIYSSLHHDEAYTYVAFALSLLAAITDYHLPNNHVFHSILVYFSTRLFGIQPWAVRLPAFTAGVLLVPAVYWLGKQFYGLWTALSAAMLVAWFPALIGYSNNARGYTMVALFTLLTFTLGNFVRKQNNLFAWLLLIIFSALGIYTVPVMLFPFGILFVWLFLEVQVEGAGSYRSKVEFFYHWLAAGFLSAVLALLLYTPIRIFTGPEMVFANGFVAPLPWADFLETLSHRFVEAWAEWTVGLPTYLILLLAAGWILSLIFHKRLSTTCVPLQLAAILWIAALLLIQRPNAWGKVWLFLLPPMLLWASAGWIGLLEKIRPKFLGGVPVAGIVVGLVMVAGIQHAAWLVPQFPALWSVQGPEEKAVLYLKSQLQREDLIIVKAPDDAPVWYYAELHGIPNTNFDIRLPFSRAFVLVDTVEGQTPASVIEKRGPVPAMINIESCQLQETINKIQVYECLHN